MNRVVKGLLVGCGVCFMTASAFAQDWNRERLMREYRGAFYDRLQADLDRAEQARYLREDDFRLFSRARREVAEFQAKWSRGYFDAREMDQAIGSVRRVTEIGGLRPDDRAALGEDLERMGMFRRHMEGGGGLPDRDRGYWDRERLMREYSGAFYGRLRADLDRAENARYLRGEDFDRFSRCRRELHEFEGKWTRGYFDPREMNEAIESLRRVVGIPGLHRDDREALVDDMQHMTSFRAHIEDRR